MPGPAPVRHAVLLAAVFVGIGVTMPFLPPFLAGRGLGAEAVAWVLLAGSVTRFLAVPPFGRLADRLADPRWLLVPAALAGVAASLLWLPAEAGWAVLLVQVLFALSIAPLIPVAEALALAACRHAGADFGRVRAAGSAAFIAAALLAGWLAARLGYEAMPWLLAAAYLASALAAWALPRPEPRPRPAGRSGPRGSWIRRGFALHLLRQPGFLRLVLLTALIQGSHAAYYGFGSIHWAAAGHSADTIGLLWAESVLVEVALFWWARPLLGRLTPRSLTLLAAAAGLLRWTGTALTTDLAALVLLQSLHALTFGAQYMAAMRWLAERAPTGEAVAAQGLHAALGNTAAMALATLLAGVLYARFGAWAFLLGTATCALAVPLALGWAAGRRAPS